MDTFVLPRGLDRSAPRDVRLSAAGHALMVVVAGLFVAAGFVAVLMSREVSREIEARDLFTSQAVRADAVVLRLWQTNDDSRRYWVEYRFDTPHGGFDSRARLSKPKWQALQVGSPLTVGYLPDDPATNYPGNRGPDAMPRWLPILLAAAMASGGVGLLWVVGRERDLLQNGRVAPATVTRQFKHHTSHGGTHRSIAYEFPVLSGATRKGKSNTSRRPPEVGSVIPVLYDAERPRRSRPYPLSLVKLV